MIAAPLKPSDESCHHVPPPTFRDHMIAATLKHTVERDCRIVSLSFRDHMIAAPLKILIGTLLTQEARSFPRSIDRGSITAINNFAPSFINH